jgi:hypothetical protein
LCHVKHCEAGRWFDDLCSLGETIRREPPSVPKDPWPAGLWQKAIERAVAAGSHACSVASWE